MELEGHPTHDIVDELKRRGAASLKGGPAGPDPTTLDELGLARSERGMWLFVPASAYDTEIDEAPNL